MFYTNFLRQFHKKTSQGKSGYKKVDECDDDSNLIEITVGMHEINSIPPTNHKGKSVDDLIREARAECLDAMTRNTEFNPLDR